MVLGTGSTLKQPFTSTVEDYNFIRLPIKYPDEPIILKFSSIVIFLWLALSLMRRGKEANG